jgi:hypothetical protein
VDSPPPIIAEDGTTGPTWHITTVTSKKTALNAEKESFNKSENRVLRSKNCWKFFHDVLFWTS